MDSFGNYSVVDPINTLWSIRTTRKAAGLAGSGDGSTRVTNTVVDYFWPAVLQGLTVEVWQRRDGNSETRVKPNYAFNAYRGPCYATVTETWTKNPPPVILPDTMIPEPIEYWGGNVRFNIPATLHPGITFTEVIGSLDPIYEPGLYQTFFPSTNYISWPTSVVASYANRQVWGGYLARTLRVFNPNS